MVFEMAVRFYCGGRIVASSELREWRQRVTNLGARLRQEISEACTLGIGTAREITALHRLAAECEASSGAPIAATVLGRASGDPRLRAYLQQLAREIRRLFGKTLYRTIATIASVASAQSVTVGMVREAAKSAICG
jgi:hypothetical protein